MIRKNVPNWDLRWKMMDDLAKEYRISSMTYISFCWMCENPNMTTVQLMQKFDMLMTLARARKPLK